MSATNSRISRVQPIFRWFEKHGGDEWPEKLLNLAEGISSEVECGPLVRPAVFETEHTQEPNPERLAWMLLNVEKLVPQKGENWAKLQQRVSDQSLVDKALADLASGQVKLSRGLKLEGPTHADCLIECQNAFIWVEGKRFDWLSPSTTWDSSRDQLARNVEAVWQLADAVKKDYYVIICHEHPLKHHEAELVQGYRTGNWSAGWPHLSAEQRMAFSTKIGTLKWQQIAAEWPELRSLPELHDLIS